MHYARALHVRRALKWGVLCIGMILGGLRVQLASAAEAAISAGASNSEHDWAAVASLDLLAAPRGFDGGRWQWQPVGALTLVDGHGASWRPHNDRVVAVASGGVALSLRDSGWFLAVQAGVADRTTPAISGHFQFVSSVGWQGRRLRLQLRHISNGRIGPGPNLGESMALVGIGF